MEKEMFFKRSIYTIAVTETIFIFAIDSAQFNICTSWFF